MTPNTLMIALVLAILLYAAVILGPRPPRVRVRIDTPSDHHYRRCYR